jgi:hypothetical protein
LINEYLIDSNITAIDLLSNVIDRYLGSTTYDVPENTLQPSEQLSTLQPHWKVKLNMLQKRGFHESTPQRDIQQYRCLTDDPLAGGNHRLGPIKGCMNWLAAFSPYQQTAHRLRESFQWQA